MAKIVPFGVIAIVAELDRDALLLSESLAANLARKALARSKPQPFEDPKLSRVEQRGHSLSLPIYLDPNRVSVSGLDGGDDLIYDPVGRHPVSLRLKVQEESVSKRWLRGLLQVFLAYIEASRE